jgi:hypothetical protein
LGGGGRGGEADGGGGDDGAAGGVGGVHVGVTGAAGWGFGQGSVRGRPYLYSCVLIPKRIGSFLIVHPR